VRGFSATTRATTSTEIIGSSRTNSVAAHATGREHLERGASSSSSRRQRRAMSRRICFR
jgi:hypothetical protein